MNRIKQKFKEFGTKVKDLLFRLYRDSYGMDDINKALLIFGLALSILNTFLQSGIIYWLSFGLMLLLFFRYFSKNKVKRIEENRKFRKWTKYYRLSWQYRKTHRIYKCKECGQYIKVPKGQGKIETTCPTCGKKEIHVS